jgi:hypothetical protein
MGMSQKVKYISVITFGFLTLLGCSPKSSPVSAIEAYLRALEAKDDVGAVNASCLAWEEGAFAEASSFEAVGVVLEGLSCSVERSGEDDASVRCEGKFVADYGGEIQNIDLSLRTFEVAREDGQWKMCGYR